MNRKQKRIAAAIAVVAVLLVAFIVWMSTDSGSPEYRQYVSYMEQSGLPALSENAAKEDAIQICGYYQGNHNNDVAVFDQTEKEAIVSGYCPDYAMLVIVQGF